MTPALMPTALLPPEPLPPAAPAPPQTRAQKVLKLIAGGMLLVAGVAMLVLPGPGIPAIVGGLFVLGDDVAWARRARLRLMAGLEAARARLHR